jgi:hypothetical protein
MAEENDEEDVIESTIHHVVECLFRIARMVLVRGKRSPFTFSRDNFGRRYQEDVGWEGGNQRRSKKLRAGIAR